MLDANLFVSLIDHVKIIYRLQGSLPSTRASIIDVYGHDSAAVASEKEVLVRMEDVFEKKEMESWEENNKMRDQTLQKLRDEEEKEREEVERLFIELKRQEHEDALQKEREEAAKMEYELRMQEEENRIEKERMRDELARKTAVLELRKKEIEKEEQEIAEIHRLEQAVITKKNEKIEALRLAELHEVEEAARLVAKKKQEEEDIAARIKQEEEEDEQERLEDEKRIADWKILEAKRNEEEIIGEVVKAKELVRRQSMVISDEVEMMKPPEVVPKDPDSDDDNDNDVDKWTDFMSIEEWDGDSAPPVVVEGGPALDSLISGKVPCPAKVGRAKKRAAEKKTPGWANDLTVSDPPSRKDSAEAVELPALPCETVKSKNLVESKAQDETVPTADQEVVPPVTLKEYFSEVAVTEPVTVKETEVEALVPAAISQPMEVLTDKVEEEKEEKKTGDEKEKEEIEKENEEMEMQEEEDIKKEIVAPRVALDLVILVSDEEAVPTEERKPLESSVPAPVLPAVASKEIVQQDSEEVIQNPPSDLDIPPDAEPNVPHKYPSNDNDSKRENVRSEKLGDLQTEGLGTELSMMRSFMESLSPSKKTAKDRLERDMQRRRSEKEEEEGPSDAKESKKAERRPSKIGKEIKLTKSQKAAKILERQKRVSRISSTVFY